MPPRSPFPDRFSPHQPPHRSAGENPAMGKPKRGEGISLPPIFAESSPEESFAPRPNPFTPRPNPHPVISANPFRSDPRVHTDGKSRSPLRKRQNSVHLPQRSPRGIPKSRPKSRKGLLAFFFKLDPFSPPVMKTLSQSSRENRRRQRSAEKLSAPVEETTEVVELESGDLPGSSPLPKGRSTRSRSKKLPTPVLYGIRLLILGVGLGVIAGTLLAALDPSYQQMVEATETDGKAQGKPFGGKNRTIAVSNPLPLAQELTPLTQELQSIANQEPDLVVGAFVVDLDSGAYAALNGQRSFATASIIKIPVLIAFFQAIDEGTLELDELLTMRKDLVAPHAGDMQYLPVGTQFSALETAEEMIRISDNTATNMLIDRLGGIAAMNQRFKDWGLSQTVINQWLPDLEGTNISSPQDLVTLMSLVEQGELVSLRSRDRLLAILRTPVTNTLLPQGLGEGATIAHKTGDIGSLVGDLGLIDMPSGKRYLAAMMVERPHNDNRAQELIRQMSRVTYDYLNQLPLTAPPKPTSGGVITQQEESVSPASL